MSQSAQNADSSCSDGELVMQAQAGDGAALETLFGRYNARICVYLVRMVGNDGVGCELTQETFLKAWEGLPRLRDPESFVGWLYRIATNVANDYLRRASLIRWLPWERHEELERCGGRGMAGPEKQVEEAEVLKLALQDVSPAYRACVILQIVEDLPQRQIAALLGIKENSVSKYVSRGLKELREAYARLMNEQEVQEER